ncbi:Cohesin loading complex subunit A [Vespula maculifrons]|uniref:Cohesin loading complex subunit A n=1 Tax=Vespula maculifrons TaxID=7453 RepID=A0ABD2C4L2_VESMC
MTTMMMTTMTMIDARAARMSGTSVDRVRLAKNTVGQPWLSAVGELVGLPWRKARYSSLGSGPPQRETPIREIRGVAEAATLPEV